jgi:hypothetical protein
MLACILIASVLSSEASTGISAGTPRSVPDHVEFRNNEISANYLIRTRNEALLNKEYLKDSVTANSQVNWLSVHRTNRNLSEVPDRDSYVYEIYRLGVEMLKSKGFLPMLLSDVKKEDDLTFIIRRLVKEGNTPSVEAVIAEISKLKHDLLRDVLLERNDRDFERVKTVVKERIELITPTPDKLLEDKISRTCFKRTIQDLISQNSTILESKETLIAYVSTTCKYRMNVIDWIKTVDQLASALKAAGNETWLPRFRDSNDPKMRNDLDILISNISKKNPTYHDVLEECRKNDMLYSLALHKGPSFDIREYIETKLFFKKRGMTLETASDYKRLKKRKKGVKRLKSQQRKTQMT